MLTNPYSGHGRARDIAESAGRRLRESGASITELIGDDADDALRLARKAVAERPAALVATGGDGLIGIALQAVAESGVPLGVIPAGTGNDHAREYGIPIGDPEAAADVIIAGTAMDVDLGHVRVADGREYWFGTVLATGFDSLVSDRTNRMTWPHGRMRYNLAILAEFLNLRPLPFRLVLDAPGGESGADGAQSGRREPDGGRIIDEDVVLAAVGNTRSYGGGMLICPDADPSDGLLDLTVIRYIPRRTLVRLFPTVFRGTHVRRPEVITTRARRIEISSPGINAYADGDNLGPLPAAITAVPRALRLLVPAARAALTQDSAES
ncbi:diacylglycerol kinase family protein [Tomitella fengzijianii]|uniref:Diacylglycerol kinase n=2 Tax=Tomitella fengzijianii TaxID=2597660 RepID=A0A516X5M7_9ACTN|nr:diacylglycerol kinase family protein [Tomitella fengzijianii]QDQ98369.1 diacylglycerol kinase [Tomitella fengzijianii]